MTVTIKLFLSDLYETRRLCMMMPPRRGIGNQCRRSADFRRLLKSRYFILAAF